MAKTTIQIVAADNGGLVFQGPALISTTAPKSAGPPIRLKTYICSTLDPTEVGTTLLALLTDINLTKHDIKDEDLEITF
jgi:hypothetical protein